MAENLRILLQKNWLARGWLAWLLWPAARLLGGVAAARRALYRVGFTASWRAPVPVVVVGNVVAGGAGKTPLVIALVRHLQTRGIPVGVVSRGHGRDGNDCLEVTARTPIAQSGDEPALIHRATGVTVFVAAKRVDAVRALLKAHPATAVVICDDGLQHYALQRDLELVVFDDRGVGNGFLLPAGPLREPWPRAATSLPMLVLHTGQRPAFGGFTSSRALANHAISRDGEHITLAALRGKPLAALAGIASPQVFFRMLEAEGLTLQSARAFPDHHDFSEGDLVGFEDLPVLCTEKDAVKLFAHPTPQAAELLSVALVFTPEPAFFEAFDKALAPLLSQLPSRHGHQTT